MDNTISTEPSPARQVSSEEIIDLLDKQKLYENMALYCRAMDRKDVETMKSTFWPEATDNHGAFDGSAHEFCEWAYRGQKSSEHRSHHYITNTLINVNGSTARRETAVVYVMVLPAANRIEMMGGRYRDFCEQRDSEWKVLRRTVVFDYAQVFDEIADFGDVFGGIPATSRFGSLYPDDPIYEAQW
ncbi:nuclear transport factor 2 family protein [Rhodococcus koreensis]|uniref:nuclear transport factor 2 family protein n=1 Tax=Rhodococcus koreensis TaxID=99653 RepID=UPI00197EB743|nr:nuclear transport factor 2 family protein [Rhodococcus koreensis]QSE85865.1 nuclear transport factor 2 family protein [Rhodococcus koreensis]